MSHTPTPWRAGTWSGICRKSAHVKVRHHPGPPECVYEPIFDAMDDNCFVGISGQEPNVTVVKIGEYGELSIQNAAFIVRACNVYEELVQALLKLVNEASSWPADKLAAIGGLTNTAVLLTRIDEARIALRKAQGEEVRE